MLSVDEINPQGDRCLRCAIKIAEKNILVREAGSLARVWHDDTIAQTR